MVKEVAIDMSDADRTAAWVELNTESAARASFKQAGSKDNKTITQWKTATR